MPKSTDNSTVFVINETPKRRTPLITKRQLKKLGEGVAIGAVTGLAVVGAITTVMLYTGTFIINEK